VPTYAHIRDGEVTERTTTVPGSTHHLEMVGRAADPGSGWALDGPPVGAPTPDPDAPEESP
jgi:hypothetical protein